MKKDKSFKFGTESVKFPLTNDVMNADKNITTKFEFFLFMPIPFENIK
jgi:hypothetical protein